jgi:SAM-dependent methyltransferase
MIEQAGATGGESFADVEKLVGLFNNAVLSQALSVAAELGIPDLLARGPRKPAELASATGCHAASLQRLMRALASIELCREHQDGSFSLTALGAVLRSDTANSLRSWAIWCGRYLWPLWGNLRHSVRTGESARKLVGGAVGQEQLANDVDAAAIFNRAMAEFTRLVARRVVRCYDFSGFKRIVDVGGGCGELLAVVLRAHPAMRGVLLELPHATEAAREYLGRAGLIERCEIVTGDCFESVPSGGDVYLLKNVIHNWDDDRSVLLLRNCRDAMTGGGKLLLVEHILPDRMEPSGAHQDIARKDLTMLIGPGGRERTAREFCSLLEAGGFRSGKIVPSTLNFCVIEAVAV